MLGGIEHLHAGTTAHGAMGSAKLGAAHAETGAAVWALGDKAVGHAAVPIKLGASLTKSRSAAHAADTNPAVLYRGRVQLEQLGVGGAYLLGLLGEDAGQG